MKHKAKALFVALTLGGMCLVTTATCDPGYGTIQIFRDDDAYDHWHGDFLLDEILFDNHHHYYEDDGFYYDGDCVLCF